MDEIIKKIGLTGIVPVLAIDDSQSAEPLMRALIAGGIPCAEVTFRTDAAEAAIDTIAKKFPDVLLGAGTVLTVDQAKRAIDLGVKFIVSPGLNRNVVEYCLSKKVTVIPGVATPSDVTTAVEFGLSTVKFFPAEANGGIPYLTALSAPFKSMKFVPTGGIDMKNLIDYLRLPSVIACGGTWMIKADVLKAKRFDEIERATREAVYGMLGFSLRHIGINSADETEAGKTAQQLMTLTGMQPLENPGAIFIGNQFEVLKKPYLGTHGHIALATNFIERAVAFLERRGFTFKAETRNEQDGKLRTIYLEKEFGGFAVHLIQA
jgi:2-dehydro-3-deoxyphosphogluconate aldolase / (4S)-4-hydroxy-2-oxoglutarate aldolase